MIYTDEQINKMTVGEAEEGIKKLRKMQGDCVGWLYPSILEDEIQKLKLRKEGKFIVDFKNKYKFISKKGGC